jgi:DNA mismatch repair protein MutS2
MIFPDNYELKIGFDRIRESVRNYCQSETAGNLLNSEGFITDYEAVRERLQKVRECLIMISEEDFAIDPYPDIRESLNKLRVQGSYLEVQEIAGLRKNLNAVREILNFFRMTKRKEDLPSLTGLSADVKIYPFVLERIDKILSKNDTIRDNASRELSRIRSEMAAKEKQVSRRLQSILKSVQSEGMVDADTELSLRNGRPVIPVSASNKRLINGIVHDESASGKTVYIEPGEVVGLNNEIRELGYAEHREIIIILTNLSTDLNPYTDDIIAMTEFLAAMDMLQAKARYARDISGVMPELVEGAMVDWTRAVHPILLKTLQKEKRKVIPLDISLSREKRILIISGPNAGGKSVCLKTVGLLQYMVQCGFLVPMHEDSKVGIFEQIFIDIGDEQSIDNDLSTYSSHLLNMKHFTKNASGATLLLIDEFGTGTEPALGGAIAEAILDKLNRLSAWGVITTHYSNLKHFAAEADGIENGAMLFDTGKMQPLYRLEIGQPGSSFAFEIARNIGLPEEVIKEASDRVGEDHVEFDKHLRHIIRDKRYWETKRDKIRVSEKRLQETLGKYAAELEDAEKSRKEILKKAKSEAEELLRQTNRKIENTIREIRESQAEKEKTRQAREKLQKFREETTSKSEAEQDPLSRKVKKVKEHEQAIRQKRQRFGQAEPVKKVPEKPLDPTISEGDSVLMKGQEVRGEVLERKGNKVSVRFGHLTTRVSVDRLEKITGDPHNPVPEKKSSGNYADWNIGLRKMQFRPEIDIRGKRAEEALKSVSMMIDEAIMVQQREIRILHGKGDGILRHLIREYLDSVDLVDKYGDEHVDLGGTGVTIVILDV